MPPLRDNATRWDQRINRAKELSEAHPFASEILAFYQQIANFQESLQARLSSARGNGSASSAASFRDSLDLGVLLPHVLSLLSLVGRVAPRALAQAAEELKREESAYWAYLLSSYWRNEAHAVEGAPEAHLFFARALLQPYAEHLACQVEIGLPRYAPSLCPICGGKPQVGVLRPEGDGAKRSLICSLCLTEWNYRRLVCPACEEERVDKLCVYTANQFEHVRVEACESCKTYIKTVDLTKNGLAIPVVDELATIPLTLWAEEKGYTKLQPNLLGM